MHGGGTEEQWQNSTFSLWPLSLTLTSPPTLSQHSLYPLPLPIHVFNWIVDQQLCRGRPHLSTLTSPFRWCHGKSNWVLRLQFSLSQIILSSNWLLVSYNDSHYKSWFPRVRWFIELVSMPLTLLAYYLHSQLNQPSDKPNHIHIFFNNGFLKGYVY